MSTEPNKCEHPDPSTQWKNRRRMAWIALFAMLVTICVLFFSIEESRIEKLSDIITWFFISMSSIVGAYMGFATIVEKWKK
jgi:hypothetical protein